MQMSSKIRILCLHGRYQNAEMFSRLCSPLQDLIDGQAELGAVDRTKHILRGDTHRTVICHFIRFASRS